MDHDFAYLWQSGGGETTTAQRVQQELGWPCVAVSRIRNALQDELHTWNAVQKLWAAWDTGDAVAGHSGIWVSTGFNWREIVALEAKPPRYLRRIWLTAPPAVLHARLIARHEAPSGYWPFVETAISLQEALCRYDTRKSPLPWVVDGIVDTNVMPLDYVVTIAVALARAPWA